MKASASSLKPLALHRFDEVIGQQNTLARLRKRLRADQHATGIILHGPEGVGKQSMACLYAAALLCTDVDAETEPCGKCDSCREVRLGGGNNLTLVDPQGQENRADDEYVGGVLGIRKWAKTGTLNGRPRVMVIKNADKIVGGDFDALLKTLEKENSSTVFVFLARRLKDVRLAGQSRCMAFRLRPLSPDELQQIAARLCAENGITCPEPVMTAAIAASGGLPGRLMMLIERMHKRSDFSLAGLKVVAGIGWLDAVVAQWGDVLMKGSVNARALLLATPGAMAERDARAQQVMIKLLAVSALGAVWEQEANDPVVNLFAAFVDYAGRVGQQPDELIRQLSTELLAGV